MEGVSLLGMPKSSPCRELCSELSHVSMGSTILHWASCPPGPVPELAWHSSEGTRVVLCPTPGPAQDSPKNGNELAKVVQWNLARKKMNSIRCPMLTCCQSRKICAREKWSFLLGCNFTQCHCSVGFAKPYGSNNII